jgi:hypothetical protein
MVVQVPIAVLFKNVRKHDELVLYIPPQPKIAVEKRSVSVLCDPLKMPMPKKAKVGKDS